MNHFCTITTADHLFKTWTLFDSIRAIQADSFMHVLCVDQQPQDILDENIAFYSLADLSDMPSARTILSKYNSSKDKLRWSFKPIFLSYLLEKKADKVVYTDNDIYFCGDYTFIFDLLDSYDFLLTPHHYPRNPNKDQNWLEANFKVGLYNAGFIGVNKNAIKDLTWWAECCAYRCEKNPLRGIFDDQKYLDLIPVMNERAYIIRHKGCNVAEWNKTLISRSERDGKVYLDDSNPLIFVHFNGTTMRAIAEGEEPILAPLFNQYLYNLRKYRHGIKAQELYNIPGIIDRVKYRIWKLATDLSL
jgi:hypothetical protein